MRTFLLALLCLAAANAGAQPSASAPEGSSFLITTVITTLTFGPGPQEPSHESQLQAIPIPVVMTAGRGSGSLAAGPGVLMRF